MDVVEAAAINFLEEGRPNNLRGIRRSMPRRVPLVSITLNFASPTAAPRPAQPPAPHRPTLQRQNAIDASGSLRNAFNFLQLLMDAGAESSDDEEVMDVEKEFDFTLLRGAAEDDWECAVCTDNGQKHLVQHPANCHVFHRRCLEEWLRRQPTCPMCRRSGAPLQMERKGIAWEAEEGNGMEDVD
jgi:hypothetical protein